MQKVSVSSITTFRAYQRAARANCQNRRLFTVWHNPRSKNCLALSYCCDDLVHSFSARFPMTQVMWYHATASVENTRYTAGVRFRSLEIHVIGKVLAAVPDLNGARVSASPRFLSPRLAETRHVSPLCLWLVSTRFRNMSKMYLDEDCDKLIIRAEFLGMTVDNIRKRLRCISLNKIINFTRHFDYYWRL